MSSFPLSDAPADPASPDADEGSAVSQPFALPPLQEHSVVMQAAHRRVAEHYADDLEHLSLAELHALKTRVMVRERQLLEEGSLDELFDSAPPDAFRTNPAAAANIRETRHNKHDPATMVSPGQPAELLAGADRLTLVAYAQLREEFTALDEVVSTRTTADLIATIRKQPDEYRIPGRRRGKNPLPATIKHVASILKLTGACVDRRLTAAAVLWPKQQYRRTALHVPQLAESLSRGEIPLTTAMIAYEKLNEIRQSVRRAGGDTEMADDLVAHSEQKFLPQAKDYNAHVFGKYAKSHSDGISHELIGPRRQLTDDQVRHEKGLFYHRPIGDRLHCLQLVVDDGQLLQLEAFREFGTNLNSSVSALRAAAHAQTSGQHGHDSLQPEDDHAGDDVPNNPRITPEDIDLGIAALFDGQTRAERWLNTVFDFLSSGLLLHKTYDPGASADQQARRNTALQKAAEHSETIADILALERPPDDAESPELSHQAPNIRSDQRIGQPTGQSAGVSVHTAPVSRADPPDDPLSALIPPGYQLLRPNVDVMVEISLRDLVGLPPGEQPAHGSRVRGPELNAIVDYLKTVDRGAQSPSGNPGDVPVDLGIARRLACEQRIIPVVLGTASQPLDVGRAQRSFPTAIRRALLIRDRGCVIPACTVPGVWCVPHHVQEWSNGGPSSLANAVLVCRQHHAAIHDGLIRVRLESDGLPSCSLPEDSTVAAAWYRNTYWQR